MRFTKRMSHSRRLVFDMERVSCEYEWKRVLSERECTLRRLCPPCLEGRASTNLLWALRVLLATDEEFASAAGWCTLNAVDP